MQKCFSLGPSTRHFLSVALQKELVQYYWEVHRDAVVCSRTTRTPGPEPNYIDSRATSHSHLVLDGRRILPSKSAAKAPNSIIQVELNRTHYVGQVISIFSHHQDRVNDTTVLLNVEWFRKLSDIDTSTWDP